ncbi:MAG: homoserine dehydrogenase [Defluviitaleaceae bacterium]|nr:homoserine dehydrogenase [Defluviitaleaceae bacterium]
MKIAILGFGVVGSGVAEVIESNRAQIFKRTNQHVEVKYILDSREISGAVKDFSVIENDEEVKIIVEAIGGDTIAYDYVKRALLRGKSVCTPNKALVASHGAELIALAKKNGCCFLFEASVGGGIPLIRPFNDAMVSIDEVKNVAGILNGTSNYILTQMSVHGKSYADALSAAQKLGYAEQDPTADVGSFDACRKLSIMLSLAIGKKVDYEKIRTEGIEKINTEDFAFGNALGFTLKQLVCGEINHADSSVEAVAAPFFVPLSHPLAAINDVYNGFWATGKTTGNIMFFGSGAGKLPTASAVVSNIADAILGCSHSYEWSNENVNVLPSEDYTFRKIIRVACDENALDGVIDSAITLAEFPGFAAWVSPLETEAETEKSLEKIKSLAGVKSVERVLRIYDAV